MTTVHVHPSIAFEGREVVKPMPIDSCISELVLALDQAGHRMLGSCCGHGKSEGVIAFDGGTERTIAEASALLQGGRP